MARLTYLFLVAFVAVAAVALPAQPGGNATGGPKAVASQESHKQDPKAAPQKEGLKDPKDSAKLTGPQDKDPKNAAPQVTPKINPKDIKSDVIPKTHAEAAKAVQGLKQAAKDVQKSPVGKSAPPQKVAGIRSGADAVSSMGAALEPSFANQWDNLFTFTHKDFQDFARKVQDGVSGASAKAVADLIAKLSKAAEERKTKFRAWVVSQGRDVSGLVTKYADLIKKRLDASVEGAADETAINALRKDDQTLVLKWQSDLLSLVNETRTAFLSIIKQAVGAITNASVKSDVKNSGKRLLWRLIDEQVRTVSLLTATQIPEFAAFVVQGGKLLFQIAVAAQADRL